MAKAKVEDDNNESDDEDLIRLAVYQGVKGVSLPKSHVAPTKKKDEGTSWNCYLIADTLTVVKQTQSSTTPKSAPQPASPTQGNDR